MVSKSIQASVAARNAVTAQKIASASPITTTSSSWGSSSGSSNQSTIDRIYDTAKSTNNTTALNALQKGWYVATSQKPVVVTTPILPWATTNMKQNWTTNLSNLYSDTYNESKGSTYKWPGVQISTWEIIAPEALVSIKGKIVVKEFYSL